jgi:hypothetical protein
MTKNNYKVSDIDDYQKKITEEQSEALIRHCNRYDIKPEICAWYDDLEDYFSDWCSESIGYTRTEARKLLHGGKGEFKTFSNGEIVRLVL